MILFAGVSGRLDPTETSLLVVPALAAALLGRLSSFAIATAAALGISMAQSVLGTFQARSDWLPHWLPNGGLREALPVLVIIVAITITGARLPTRDTILETRQPSSPVPRHPLIATLVLVGLTVLGLLTLDELWRLAIVVSIIAAIIALSSVVLTGYVGQISLAQYAFAGLAAFATAKLAIEGVAFPWAPILAVTLTVVVGVLVGLPALRVRGVTLAVATIGAAVAIEQLVFNSPALNGLSGVPDPHLFGIDLAFLAPGRDNFRPEFGIFALVVLAVCALAVANWRRSPTGLRWLAVRSNERAAAAAGIDVGAAKLHAFGVSSAIAGIGGALLAYELPALSPQQFLVVGALAVLALCYLGGIASVTGALVAGVLASGGHTDAAAGRRDGEGVELPVRGERAAAHCGGDPGAGRPRSHGPAPRRALGPGPPANDMSDLLVVRDLSVSYGGLRALDDVSFSVGVDAILGLIGPNGAGKTTAIDAICGFVPHASGSVRLAGRSLEHLPPHERARAGLARTFQSVELFADLTVRENLLVAATPRRWWSSLMDAVAPLRRGARDVDVSDELDLVGLTAVADARPHELAHGQRRLAGVARALAARPRLLILDEPAAGLDPDETAAFGAVLRGLPALGVGVLLIDHDMSLVHDVCAELVVLDVGRVIAQGPTQAVMAAPEVVAAYLGRTP